MLREPVVHLELFLCLRRGTKPKPAALAFAGVEGGGRALAW